MNFAAPFLPNGLMETWTYTNYSDGDYDTNGEYQPGNPNTISFNAVQMPLSNDDIKYDSSGTYTSESQKLYTYTKLINGIKITNPKNKEYTVQEQKSYYPHANGLYIYIIRRVATTVTGG